MSKVYDRQYPSDWRESSGALSNIICTSRHGTTLGQTKDHMSEYDVMTSAQLQVVADDGSRMSHARGCP